MAKVPYEARQVEHRMQESEPAAQVSGTLSDWTEARDQAEAVGSGLAENRGMI